MLTLNDGRSELWQWDTGRTLGVDADCSQVHFSNKVFGRSIDVDVVGGVAIIPDILLQTDKDLNIWAFVGTAESGYTKISKTFKVNRRNKPADYVFTPTDQMTLQMIQLQIGDLADLTTEAKDTLVAAINEAARTGGGAGSMDLRVADGYIQYSRDGGMTWTNLIAIADLKGDPGEPGKDGHSPVVTATKSGKTTTISVDGAAIATVEDGADGKPGTAGADGVTPHIGDNGNWYLGETDTGKPSRGADGATGATGEKGTDGKSAYAYAVEGGYTGTEAEFAAKLAKEYPDGIVEATGGTVTEGNLVVWDADRSLVRDGGAVPEKLPNPNALTFTGAVTGSYDGSAALSVEIPSGGGGTEREWTVLGDIDISTFGGGSIELTGLDNFTEFYITWGNVINESETASGYNLSINGVNISNHAVPIAKSGTTTYGWTYARYNGLIWEIQKSAGAVSQTNITVAYLNANFPYNHLFDVGTATELLLTQPLPAYVAVSGNIKIYGR